MFTYNSVHYKAGAACADCHMPYTKVGAYKVSEPPCHKPAEERFKGMRAVPFRERRMVKGTGGSHSGQDGISYASRRAMQLQQWQSFWRKPIRHRNPGRRSIKNCMIKQKNIMRMLFIVESMLELKTRSAFITLRKRQEYSETQSPLQQSLKPCSDRPLHWRALKCL